MLHKYRAHIVFAGVVGALLVVPVAAGRGVRAVAAGWGEGALSCCDAPDAM